MKKLSCLLTILGFATNAIADGYYEIKNNATEAQWKVKIQQMKQWAKDHPGVPPPLSPEEDYAIFGKDNLPRPNSGVHVLPAGQMHYSSTQVKNIKTKMKALNDKGYVEEYNQNAATLLMFHQIANADYSKNYELTDQSTHLRHHASDLKMAYDYQDVPSNLVKKTIGFAPMSVFMKEGWAGAVEYFNPEAFEGVCKYQEVNIKLTGSSANFAEEIVSHHVNDKITLLEISGNDTSGYEYNVEWWDNNYRHVLTCASKTFSPEIKQKTIALAKQIDTKQ